MNQDEFCFEQPLRIPKQAPISNDATGTEMDTELPERRTNRVDPWLIIDLQKKQIAQLTSKLDYAYELIEKYKKQLNRKDARLSNSSSTSNIRRKRASSSPMMIVDEPCVADLTPTNSLSNSNSNKENGDDSSGSEYSPVPPESDYENDQESIPIVVASAAGLRIQKSLDSLSMLSKQSGYSNNTKQSTSNYNSNNSNNNLKEINDEIEEDGLLRKPSKHDRSVSMPINAPRDLHVDTTAPSTVSTLNSNFSPRKSLQSLPLDSGMSINSSETSIKTYSPIRKGNASVSSPIRKSFRALSNSSTTNNNQQPLSPARSNLLNNDNSSIVVHQRTKSTEVPVTLFVKPEEMSSITIHVHSSISSSSINSSKKSSADPIITFSCRDRESNKELWKINKSFKSISQLDKEIRLNISIFSLPKLPNKSLFLSHSPIKIENRHQSLLNYFQAIFSIPHLPHDTAMKICKFLSSDIVNPLDDNSMGGRKEGYVTTRGKGLSGWKARYCVLDGSILDYYDERNGTLLGSITLSGARVFCQIDDNTNNNTNNTNDKTSYRHAFSIVEQQKGNQSTKHVFCAESNEDRDDWMEALLEFIEPVGNSNNNHNSLYQLGNGNNRSGQSFGSTEPSLPSVGPSSGDYLTSSGSIKNNGNNLSNNNNHKSHSRSLSGLLMNTDDLEKSMENAITLEKEREKDLRKQRKRSFFPFKTNILQHTSNSTSSISNSGSFNNNNINAVTDLTDLAFSSDSSPRAPSRASGQGSMGTPVQTNNNESSPYQLKALPRSPTYGRFVESPLNYTPEESMSNPVFGVTLEESVNICSKDLDGKIIPAVVFECLVYLDKHDAIFEEGIFRLNGSSSMIKSLKKKFNDGIDVDLFKLPTLPDINSIAGLLKLYLREIKSEILTIELHSKFRDATLFPNFSTTLLTYQGLVELLPQKNKDLLYVLFKFLDIVIENSNLNKMTLRNLSIVFSPTLNISIDVLLPFLSDWGCIFNGNSPDFEKFKKVVDVPSIKF